MFEECIRCSEAPAVDDLGYCGHCHWAVRAEIEEGFYQLREYLRAWARFSDWCHARVSATATSIAHHATVLLHAPAAANPPIAVAIACAQVFSFPRSRAAMTT